MLASLTLLVPVHTLAAAAQAKADSPSTAAKPGDPRQTAKPSDTRQTARPSDARQNAEAKDGGIAVNASGEARVEIHQTIQQRDPELSRSLKRLQERMETLSDQMEGLKRDGKERQRRLLDDQTHALDEVLRKSRAPNASATALAAWRGLEQGDTLDAEIFLKQIEEVAAGKQPPDMRRAAELARQQGSLAMSRDTSVALAAYQRAVDYEPDNPDNWWSLGDLLMQSLRRADAAQAYERLTTLATERSRRQPSSTYARSMLVSGYRNMSFAFVALDQIPRASEAAEKSLALAERWSTEQPTNSDVQNQLLLSLIQMARVRLAGMDEVMKDDNTTATMSARDRMTALANEIARRASEAEALYRRSLTIVNTLLDRDLDNDNLWIQSADCHEGIAWALELQLQSSPARTEFTKSIDILERVAKKNPKNTSYQRTLALAYSALGTHFARSEQNAANALQAYRKSVDISRRLALQNPSSPRLQLDLVNLYLKLAWLAQPWVEVPSLLDPNYRDYMKPPLIKRAEAIALLQEGQRIVSDLDSKGLLAGPEKDLQRELQFDLQDVRCQQQGFESGFNGQCFRPLPAHLRSD